MNVRTRLSLAVTSAAALAMTALFIVSCSKHLTGVDPSFSTPEGTASSLSRLIVWRSGPNTALRYKDIPPIGPGPEDNLLRSVVYRRDPVGTVRGVVLDGTSASEYQVLRREQNGGLRAIEDFMFSPVRRWLDGKWEAYEFADTQPIPGPRYIGRGLIGGDIGSQSPLSNEASPDSVPPLDIPITFPGDTTILWNAVPGAAFYIAQIYQLRPVEPVVKILSGSAEPLYLGQSRDFFLGFTTTPQRIGHHQPFVGTVLTNREMVPGQYLGRVSAIDAAGRLIAYSYGDSDNAIDNDEYERFALGAGILPHVLPVVRGGGGGTLAQRHPLTGIRKPRGF